MKVYVISSVPSGGEEITDVLDDSNVSVISKEVSDDIEDVQAEIEKHVENGRSDMLIYVTDDAIGAGIALNKMEGVRAATCNNSEDVAAARASGANVIILPEGKADKEDIANAIAKGGSGFGKILQKPRPQQARRPSRPQERQQQSYEQEYDDYQQKKENGAPITINIKMPKLFGPKKAKVQKEEPEERAAPPMGKPRSGLLGKIKDELGILD
ncbi:MAG: RpiB/LacA/LacB family sugar-phosphate isomerase [Candidatus Micrarchaeota archaeon]|nr:RpiB/LacA/LacB family sugar-phosphate isomerase [Candidatus Micrarchaeota archaeon]